jgi:hypothetical protein
VLYWGYWDVGGKRKQKMNIPEYMPFLYRFLDGEISIHEFEQWIYDNESQIENKENLMELISFDYKKCNAIDTIKFLVYNSMIDVRDYTEWRLKKLLNLLTDNEKRISAIWALYWELWDDNTRFKFLLPLCNYGAALIQKLDNFGITGFIGDNKAKIEREFLYPKINEESIYLLKAIDNGQILITGEKEFIDIREGIPSRMSFDEILKEIRNRIK